MVRIISDYYAKKDKQIWGEDREDEFNRRILAVNDMYGWLYDKGILQKVSFVFKDYADGSHFAMDVKDLLPFRKEMESSGMKDALLAVHHIFDESYTPCTYSGAIQLGWTMASYRSVDGSVGRSWECNMVKNLNTDGIYDVLRIREGEGVKAAVKGLYDMFDWNPTLNEQNAPALDETIQIAASKNSSELNTIKDKEREPSPER